MNVLLVLQNHPSMQAYLTCGAAALTTAIMEAAVAMLAELRSDPGQTRAPAQDRDGPEWCVPQRGASISATRPGARVTLDRSLLLETKAACVTLKLT